MKSMKRLFTLVMSISLLTGCTTSRGDITIKEAEKLFDTEVHTSATTNFAMKYREEHRTEETAPIRGSDEDPDNPIYRYGEKIVYAFKTGNAEALKMIFSDELNSKETIDEDIQTAFDFIGGDILEYGDYEEISHISYAVTGGMHSSFRMHIQTIETESGSYFISANVITGDPDESKIGIEGLTVYKKSKKGKVYADCFEIDTP